MCQPVLELLVESGDLHGAFLVAILATLTSGQQALTPEWEVSLIIVPKADGQPHQEPRARHLNSETERSQCG